MIRVMSSCRYLDSATGKRELVYCTLKLAHMKESSYWTVTSTNTAECKRQNVRTTRIRRSGNLMERSRAWGVNDVFTTLRALAAVTKYELGVGPN